MYERISVENFRGLRQLSVDDLGRINLFVGPNNAGKTILLEALWLLQNPGNPTLIQNLSVFRGFPLQPQAPNLTWPTLFYDSDRSKRIEIVGQRCDGEVEALAISVRNDWPDEAAVGAIGSRSGSNGQGGDISVLTPETLYYDYRRNDQAPLRSSFSVGLGRIGVRPNTDAPSSRSIMLAARQRSTPEEMASRFTTMQDTMGITTLAHTLSVLQPGLETLSIGLRALDGSAPQVQLRAHISGLSAPLPLQSLGEGVGRLTEILLAMASLPDGVLLVDEIENGLYYRNLVTAWETIDEISREAKVQLFATTHNSECVQAAVRALDGESAADFRLYRLEPIDDGIDVIAYDHQTAAAALAFEVEFR